MSDITKTVIIGVLCFLVCICGYIWLILLCVGG